VAYEHVVMKISDVDVFLNDSVLGYVVRIRLMNTVVLSVYKLIQFPTRIKNSEDTFPFIGNEKDYLLMDTLKQMCSN
jgi:hypothetical protein